MVVQGHVIAQSYTAPADTRYVRDSWLSCIQITPKYSWMFFCRNEKMS